MTAIPPFAGTARPSDLLTKLDAQRVEIESRTAAADARTAALEGFIARQTGGYGLGPISDAPVFTYSAKAIPGWTSATRKGRLALALSLQAGSWFDADGRATVTKLADLPNGAQRYVAVTWNSAGTVNGSGGYAVLVTVFDVAADGSVALVRQASGQGYGVFGESTPNLYYYTGTAQVFRVSDTQFKVRAIYRVDSNYGTSGSNTLYTYTLNTDQGANTLSSTQDVNLQVYRGSASSATWLPNLNFSGFYRRRAWPVGSYGVAWPTIVNAQDGGFGGRVALGALIGDRIPGSGYADARTLAPSYLATFTSCMERIGGASWATLTDGVVAGRSSPAASAKVSVVGLDDSFAGAVAGCSIPVAVAGNPRLQPLSAAAFVAGWTNGGQFSSYLVTRDPITGSMTWRGASDATGALGLPWAESHAFATNKVALWTVAAGWTFNLTTVAVDPTVAPGGASPFAQAAQVAVNLCASVANAVAGDTVILGAVERLGPDRVLTIARNATRGGCDVEVWDLA